MWVSASSQPSLRSLSLRLLALTRRLEENPRATMALVLELRDTAEAIARFSDQVGVCQRFSVEGDASVAQTADHD
jgi:hypothetical protein